MKIIKQNHSFRSQPHRVPLPSTAMGLIVFMAVLFGGLYQGSAIPYWAWKTGRSCIDCHSITPKLNVAGESFIANGYRLPDSVAGKGQPAVPISAWFTGRFEDKQSNVDHNDVFIPKVELISGGPISDLPMSYFVEWRIVSLGTRNDGTLRDRGGRFEDAFLNWQMNDAFALRVGQFRALNQVDISRRLSVSEPAIFSSSLPGDPATSGRITSLRGFSPSGRSPGFALEYQSIPGKRASDGLFHHVTLPFVGELSAPLSEEARREASFELQGPPKGVFLETFYRKGLSSIGAHAFLDDDRWLLTGVGTYNYRDLYLTGGVGVDNTDTRPSRGRYSMQLEYLPEFHDKYRPGAGFRVEHISNDGRPTRFIPYLLLSGPNQKANFWLQLEYRIESNNNAVFLDLSAAF